ncbi:MAG: hypothetical protein HYX65_05280 [Gemmatimonadetes bacterium]|nr:hypothetical protein [Gemmatimonadota bacterium]
MRAPATSAPAAVLALTACCGVLAAACSADSTAPGPASTIAAMSAVEQSGRAGELAPESLRVRVLDGARRPVRGATVRFELASGAGTLRVPGLAGASPTAFLSTTDSGVAVVAWDLGPTLGRQEVRATATGADGTVTFGAAVRAGPARTVERLQGDLQVGAVGAALPVAPRVRLLDAYGHAVADEPVTFWAATGGSRIDGGEATTDSSGVASAGTWTLGGCGGQSLVEARTANGASAAFTATATGGPDVCIAVSYLSPPAPSLRAATDSAAARWSRTILTRFDPLLVDIGIYDCFVTIRPTRRDVEAPLIFVDFVAIPPTPTGRAILGSAGPCLLRPSGFPLAGFIRLNSEFMLANLSQAQIEAVVLHEMGHILGIGTLWSGTTGTIPDLFSDPPPGGAPRFTGPLAIATYRGLPGGDAAATGVPIETCGPAGTANAHWSEQVFGDELMTGYLGARGVLSTLTISAMADLGYATDSTQASPYVVSGNPCPAAALRFAPPGSVVVGGVIATETLIGPTGIVRNGRVERIVRH